MSAIRVFLYVGIWPGHESLSIIWTPLFGVSIKREFTV